MYSWFSTLKEALKYIDNYNQINEDKAKLVAWPCTQVKKSNLEFCVFNIKKD